MAKDITNTIELRKSILRNTQLLEMGHIDVRTAAVIAKNNETVVNSLKVDILYAKSRGETPEIEFLKGEDDIRTLVVMDKKKPKRDNKK